MVLRGNWQPRDVVHGLGAAIADVAEIVHVEGGIKQGIATKTETKKLDGQGGSLRGVVL